MQRGIFHFFVLPCPILSCHVLSCLSLLLSCLFFLLTFLCTCPLDVLCVLCLIYFFEPFLCFIYFWLLVVCSDDLGFVAVTVLCACFMYCGLRVSSCCCEMIFVRLGGERREGRGPGRCCPFVVTSKITFLLGRHRILPA